MLAVPDATSVFQNTESDTSSPPCLASCSSRLLPVSPHPLPEPVRSLPPRRPRLLPTSRRHIRLCQLFYIPHTMATENRTIVARRDDSDDSPLHHILVSLAFLNEACQAATQQLTDDSRVLWSNNAYIALGCIADCTAWDASEARYEDLLHEVEAYQTRTAELERLLMEQCLISSRLAELQGPPNNRVKPADIPDPDTFDGTRDNLRPFITKLRLKIAGNSDQFHDTQHQLRYAFSFLRGPAYKTMEPHLHNDEINFTSLERFIEVLCIAFGDPDEVKTAVRKLEAIRQNNREFSQYYADFQRLITILQYDDQAKHHALERGLNWEIKDALVHQDGPPEETFERFVARLNRLDNRIRARKQEYNVGESTNLSGGTTTRAPHTTVTQPVAVIEQGTTDIGTHPGPINLSANRGRISAAQRACRIAQGLCNYCGGTGHFAAQCLRGNRKHGILTRRGGGFLREVRRRQR